ncbi:DUF2269 family protein [Pseudomonas sp. B392_1p]|jgi:uncharacterized membrane protein|uniref:DUF2269 family protein n=1 Tax=Pseudomonas sp. B392_1p TaxID=3457507 RepID=UPI003FD4EB1F
MEAYLSLQILQGLLAVLLLAVGAGLAWMVWHRWQASSWPQRPALDASVRVGLPALAVLVIAAPIVAWWLLHLGEVPFGYLWVLGSACLYLLAGIAWLLLGQRLLRVYRQPALADQARFLPVTFACAVVALVVLLIILLLIALRPL